MQIVLIFIARWKTQQDAAAVTVDCWLIADFDC